MSAAFDDEPSGLHVLGCAIWLSDSAPCDCGTDEHHPLPPLPGTTAARLDQLHVELDCDTDGAA